MWGWTRDVRTLKESLARFDKALDDLATCCSNNADHVRELKSSEKALRADVDLQWDKVNRALGRMAKRDAVDGKGNGESELDLNEKIRRGIPI